MNFDTLTTCRRTITFFLGTLVMAGWASAESTSSVHFKPANHVLGDVHPYFEKGVCFLFYLRPKSYEVSLARSKDLLHWTEVPIRHTADAPKDRMRPYYVLGIVRDRRAAVYRSFYGQAQGRMVSSVSSNLLDWDCAITAFSIQPQGDYARRRDPFVFWNEEERRYWCVMTTQMKDRPAKHAGAISYATSADLTHWKNRGVLFDPGNIGEPECPQMFRLKRRWYLLASIHDRAVGKPSYWISEKATGPWRAETSGSLDGKDFCAAQVAWDGEKFVLFGWIPLTASKPGRQHWGGHLALPREVYSLPDGTLGTRLLPAVGDRIRGDRLFTLTGQPVRLDEKTPRHKIRLPSGSGGMNIELRLEPDKDCAQTGLVLYDQLGKRSIAINLDLTKSRLSIHGPSGHTWSERPIEVKPGQVLPLRIVVEEDIVEVFLLDRYSLVARVPRKTEWESLDVFTQGASLQLRVLTVSELKQ